MAETAPGTALLAQGDAVRLEERHLSQALALSQALNWPYRFEDWAFAFALGRGFAIEVDGRLAGTALWWPYGDHHGSAGMIIVAPDAQRQGIGARLMDALLADAAGRTIILNSTVEGDTLYRRLGFSPHDVVQQRQAVLAVAPALDPDVPLRAAQASDRAALEALDRAASGMDRGGLLDAVFRIADVLVVEREGRITGYGCVRRWGRGFVIGPVAASSERDAKALIAALAARHVGAFVRIDVMESGGLGPWLDTIGLPQTDRAVAMSLGAPPQADPGVTLFALSNQSLG
ncbi:GNAT family N-acetyltransferase [Sphingomonas sp. MG17]|uniref:GNAT family N-acetyltransferase n=1 Tax=Sphingomonas tagetis TaxID=2949092 RepID=A0A9X2KLE6_9SPHN|nr:GNAT family N-acetyltransferase [Sphingomonas tagetis]MCP3731469.1 GNAT family N-acetyltransferase [Sphingomonas tagetis]